jgi:hypothetical protein
MQKVQEVRDDSDEPEILFIGHTEACECEACECEGGWKKIPARGHARSVVPMQRPPGLENKFKVLEVGEADPDEEYEIRKVEAPKCEIDHSKGERGDKRRKKEWVSLGIGEIVVDSAADESCWPKGHGDALQTKPSSKRISLRTANGGEMGHYGEKEITFRSGQDDEIVGLKFQVTDVRKPLLAVRRLVERGNVVSFGPDAEQNYILNVSSGRKIMMEKRGGAFVINAHFVQADSEVFPRPA